MTTTPDFIPVLLGANATAYGFARSFFEAFGVISQAVALRSYPICEESAVVSLAAIDANLTDDAVFLRVLQELADSAEWAGRTLLLVPTENIYARLLARHAHELSDRYHFAISGDEVVRQVATKDCFYRLCARQGLAVPDYQVIAHATHPEDCRLSFPVILKPDDPDAFARCVYRGKKNAYEIRTQAELDYALSCAAKAGFDGAMLVQRECAGADDALRTVTCYRNAQGMVSLYCQGDVILELASPWGIGHFGAVVAGSDEGLRLQIESLLAGLDYHGFCNIDVKTDAQTGAAVFLDFNVSPCDTSFLATVAGANLSIALVDDVLGRISGASQSVQAESALLSQIPESTIRQYARKLAIWDRVRLFLEGKKVTGLFDPPYDQNFKRWKAYKSDQHFHRREFADCYGRNHVND
ncbi:MAG: hypothetical protein ACOX1O_06175 [Eggerthellaceae bacterium]|jgi:D-aspartate ligase